MAPAEKRPQMYAHLFEGALPVRLLVSFLSLSSQCFSCRVLGDVIQNRVAHLFVVNDGRYRSLNAVCTGPLEKAGSDN